MMKVKMMKTWMVDNNIMKMKICNRKVIDLIKMMKKNIKEMNNKKSNKVITHTIRF
jgi:hypothetical protein